MATVNILVYPASTNAMLPYNMGGLGAISYFSVFLFSIMTTVMNWTA